MTITEILEKIKEIKTVLDDDEAAHGLEDSLYFDFIKYISETNPIEDPQLDIKAKLILKTKELKFARWCA